MGLGVVSFWIGKVEDGVAFASKGNAVVNGWKEPTSIVAGPGAGAFGAAEDDVSRKVFAFVAESVETPGSEAGSAELRMTGVEHELRRSVVDRIGLHGLNEAEVVNVFGDIGQEFAELDTALAVPVELEFRAEESGLGIDEGGAIAFEQFGGRQFAVTLDQFLFVIEKIEVTGGAGLEDVDDAFRFRGEVRQARGEWIGGSIDLSFSPAKERVQGEPSHADSAIAEKPATRLDRCQFIFEFVMHDA